MTTQRPVQAMQSPEEFDRLAVLTIQGGGVYGLNMLGQLATVLDHYRIKPLAYAGTSAGAVVAALSWAGYSPKEIRDLFVKLAVDGSGTGGSGPIAGEPRTVIDLLGPIENSPGRFDYDDFKRMARSFRGTVTWLGSTLDPASAHPDHIPGSRRPRLRPLREMAFLLSFLAIVIGASQYSGFHAALCWAGASLVVASRLCLGPCQRLWQFGRLAHSVAKAARQLHSPGYLRRGFFSGDHLEGFIDRCLKDSPRFKAHAAALGDAPLTFGWVDRLVEERDEASLAAIVPLILTATNLTTRELILIRSFDTRFHSLSVAKAVRASAGFPVFFRPVDLRCPGLTGWYVDGGMISNFPAWVFSQELRRSMVHAGRYLDLAIRPWLNIGLRVVPDRSGPASPDDRPSEFIVSLFDLARGQVRNELERELAARLPRAIPILQPTSQTNAPPNLLDVDQLTNDKIRAMFARGEEFAREALRPYSFSLPAGPRALAIERALERLASQALRCFPDSPDDPSSPRANVFVPRAQKLVMAYSYGMGDDHDRHLEFNYNAGLTGFCFLNRRPFLCNLRYTRQWAEQAPSPDATLLGMSRDAHLAVREDRTWLASVPIFDPMDCGFLDAHTPRMGKDPEELSVWADLPGILDGAVFGVLNIDAAINYDKLNLPEDPEDSLTDPRIASIFNSLLACSFEIGRIFSEAFGKKRES